MFPPAYRHLSSFALITPHGTAYFYVGQLLPQPVLYLFIENAGHQDHNRGDIPPQFQIEARDAIKNFENCIIRP